jgi:hypothetical protein
MDFKTYYSSKFQEDLTVFFSTIPIESKFHEDKQNKLIYSVQLERLTPSFNHLEFLEKETKEYFGVALFFVVLIDMVCFTHFKIHYKKFKVLTRYPKFIGNCPCVCNVHYHPIEIFLALNKAGSNQKTCLNFFDKLAEAIDTMHKETINFLTKHVPEIEGEMFWSKCKKEFPCKTDRILYKSQNL